MWIAVDSRFRYVLKEPNDKLPIDTLASVEFMVGLCYIPPCVLYLQPECSFNLTVTWTPTEEGGIRELLVFCANGILKHQAVLLGRAEAPKKKKVNMLYSPQLFKDVVSIILKKFNFYHKFLMYKIIYHTVPLICI